MRYIIFYKEIPLIWQLKLHFNKQTGFFYTKRGYLKNINVKIMKKKYYTLMAENQFFDTHNTISHVHFRYIIFLRAIILQK